MSKNYQDIITRVSANVGKFSKESSSTMQAFHQLSQAATKDGALSEKTKELIALAIGIAKQCDACIGFHTQKLVKLGVDKNEFVEMLNVAVYMGGGPSLMYATEALSAFEEFSK